MVHPKGIDTTISQGEQMRRPASVEPDPKTEIKGNQLLPSSPSHEAEPAVCRSIFPFQNTAASLPRHSLISSSSQLDYAIISFLSCQTPNISFSNCYHHNFLVALGLMSTMPLLLYARDISEDEGHPSQSSGNHPFRPLHQKIYPRRGKPPYYRPIKNWRSYEFPSGHHATQSLLSRNNP